MVSSTFICTISSSRLTFAWSCSAEQDQANVSLLEEMVQMKVELTMAKNSLDQKASEVATALEDNGLENAKSLTTHIEKWLMHQPDRTQWKMEEPVAQN